MLWFVVIVLALVVVIALVAVLALSVAPRPTALDEEALIEMEVRRAERRLHDLARTSLSAMIDEVRTNHPDALARQ